MAGVAAGLVALPSAAWIWMAAQLIWKPSGTPIPVAVGVVTFAVAEVSSSYAFLALASGWKSGTPRSIRTAVRACSCLCNSVHPLLLALLYLDPDGSSAEGMRNAWIVVGGSLPTLVATMAPARVLGVRDSR